MPEYLSPGVYVEEVDTGSKTIEGVSTSTAGFIGMTVRGPVIGLPTLVTSFADFERKFGGYFDFGLADSNYLPHAVNGFFNNGGKRLYISRVAASDADVAKGDSFGGVVTRLTADVSSTTKTIKLASLRGIQSGTVIQLQQVKDGLITQDVLVTHTVDTINASTGEVTVTANITGTFEARYTRVYTNVDEFDANLLTGTGAVTTLANPLATRNSSFGLMAANPGTWGYDIDIQARPESKAKSELSSVLINADGGNQVRVVSGSGFYVGAWVEIEIGKTGDKNTKIYRQVTAVNGANLTLTGKSFTGSIDPDAGKKTTIATCEFSLTIAYGTTVEQFSGLTLENIPGRYYADRLTNESMLIAPDAAPGGTTPFFFPVGDVVPSTGMRTAGEQLRTLLTKNASDGSAPSDADYLGVDNGPAKRTGLKALEDIDQVSILAAPGIVSTTVQGALIEQCERLKDRFAVLDPDNQQQTIDEIVDQRKSFDTKYAAIYYPRVTTLDPLSGVGITIPPSGHVVGIYARTDIERGVHKAPANEVLRGITGLDLTINKAEQDILNPMPNNVNVLRDFRSDGRGYRVWGARVMTSDTDWKYINVRRLFIYIEESIDEGTQWVVFEPNDEPTWARVRRTVGNFLTNVWRTGALQGKKAEEAFFVRCDRTTMSQDDIDNGRLIMVIGIAPVKPAEFVIFRIGQWTGGSAVDEG